MAITRISVTLPTQLAQAIDAKAKELDRSRSWVIAEGARRLLGRSDGQTARLGQDEGGGRSSQVAEPSTPYTVSPGLGESRLRQLEADLRLTPTERVRAAQKTRLVSEHTFKGKGRKHQVVSFERYEDYLDWKRHEDLRP